MGSLSKFGKQIFKYSMIIAVIMELGSLIPLGLDARFLLGLVAGLAITMVNFVILEISAVQLMQKNSGAPVVTGYFIRMVTYGIAFYFCIKVSIICGIGCGVGFLTLPLAMIYLYGIKSRFPGAEKNPLNDWTEPKEWKDSSEWDDEEDDWGPLPKWTKDNKKK
jgi:hypothetical protein